MSSTLNETINLTINPKDFIIPKNNSRSVAHNSAFNELFVAITRAQNSVVIYQPESKNKNIRILASSIKNFVAKINLSLTDLQQVTTSTSLQNHYDNSRKEDWKNRADIL